MAPQGKRCWTCKWSLALGVKFPMNSITVVSHCIISCVLMNEMTAHTVLGMLVSLCAFSISSANFSVIGKY